MKISKILILTAIVCAPALFGEDFDFRTLDKIGARAKSTTNVTLDKETLKLATGFLGKDDSSATKLNAVYVRSWEFDKEKQYSAADLVPFRDYLKRSGWKAIVDVQEGGEWTQVFLQPSADGKLAGLAVVSTAAEEVTVVYLSGDFTMSDLSKLGGNMGIPDLSKQLPRQNK